MYESGQFLVSEDGNVVKVFDTTKTTILVGNVKDDAEWMFKTVADRKYSIAEALAVPAPAPAPAARSEAIESWATLMRHAEAVRGTPGLTPRQRDRATEALECLVEMVDVVTTDSSQSVTPGQTWADSACRQYKIDRRVTSQDDPLFCMSQDGEWAGYMRGSVIAEHYALVPWGCVAEVCDICAGIIDDDPRPSDLDDGQPFICPRCQRLGIIGEG